MPSEVRITAEDFESESQKNPDFVKAIKAVKEDSRFRKDFDHALIKHKNRYIDEYVFSIENLEESIQFFLIQNIKSKTVTIIDYWRKPKDQLKPLVSKVIDAIDTDQWKSVDGKVQEYKPNPNLTPSENKVAELVH